MDAFVTCQQAATKICQEDITSLTQKKSTLHVNWCEIADASYDDLATLAYKCQGAHHIGIFLAKTATVAELEKLLRDQKVDFSPITELISHASTFRVKAAKHDPAEVHPDNKYTTVDISSQIGAATHAMLQKGNKITVSMKKADLPFIVIITPKEVIFGIDVVGQDLSKRPYKIFSHPSSTNGVVAYSIARLAGAKKDSVIMDPFCDCATIPIEMSLWQNNSSPFIYDRKFMGLFDEVLKTSFEKVEQEIKAQKKEKAENIFAFEPQLRVMLQAKKNIKLAGVQDQLLCSKVSTDWLDAKFEEHTVDIIVAKPPQISKRNPAVKQIKKIYDELFYQARYLLKTEGTIGLLMHNPDHVQEAAEKYQYKEVARHTIYGGQQALLLVLFKQ